MGVQGDEVLDVRARVSFTNAPEGGAEVAVTWPRAIFDTANEGDDAGRRHSRG